MSMKSFAVVAAVVAGTATVLLFLAWSLHAEPSAQVQSDTPTSPAAFTLDCAALGMQRFVRGEQTICSAEEADAWQVSVTAMEGQWADPETFIASVNDGVPTTHPGHLHVDGDAVIGGGRFVVTHQIIEKAPPSQYVAYGLHAGTLYSFAVRGDRAVFDGSVRALTFAP